MIKKKLRTRKLRYGFKACRYIKSVKISESVRLKPVKNRTLSSDAARVDNVFITSLDLVDVVMTYTSEHIIVWSQP